jgi:hypothetical protein
MYRKRYWDNYHQALIDAGSRRTMMTMHIAQLLEQHCIGLEFKKRGGSASSYRPSPHDDRPERGVIIIPPIKSEITYATALHEIGHIMSGVREGTHGTLTSEWAAWVWAQDNALEWTPRMESTAQRSFESYYCDPKFHQREVSVSFDGEPTFTWNATRDEYEKMIAVMSKPAPQYLPSEVLQAVYRDRANPAITSDEVKARGMMVTLVYCLARLPTNHPDHPGMMGDYFGHQDFEIDISRVGNKLELKFLVTPPQQDAVREIEPAAD